MNLLRSNSRRRCGNRMRQNECCRNFAQDDEILRTGLRQVKGWNTCGLVWPKVFGCGGVGVLRGAGLFVFLDLLGWAGSSGDPIESRAEGSPCQLPCLASSWAYL